MRKVSIPERKNHRFVSLLSIAFVAVMIMAMTGTSDKPAPPRPQGPCDIYAAAGYPCMTAHSTTRALLSTYNGPLYQVKRDSDGKTMDIGVVQPKGNDAGGYADASAQDDFCSGTLCWITKVYDQSGNGNHLVQAPPGTFVGPAPGGFNTLPIADMAPVTINGRKAYGVYIMPGAGLRNNNASGLAINDEPQGIYMVADAKHFDSGCCFNYGNTSTNSRAVGRGTMSTVYFGTATAWGSGSGSGPWIMSDMEAGLFSGYNTKVNEENPTIDSWDFVTGMVNGGGGNQWEIRGGNAQKGGLSTFYKGIRPQSRENDNYYPMHQKGSVQLGNGGDNGNGSAGTFFEGVMVRGYPDETTTDAVQANIVAAGYNVAPVQLTRLKTFTPKSNQEVTVTFTNTTGAPVSGVKLSVSLRKGWTAVVSGTTDKSKTFAGPVAPNSSVSATFTVTSPGTTDAGYLSGVAEWRGTTGKESAMLARRIRNVFPVKINEVRLGTGINPTDQFIELYNASDNEVDMSGWKLVNTRSEWAPVTLGTIPSGTTIKPRGFYVLGLSASGLIAPAHAGENTINVTSTTGFTVGQEISIGNETHKIASIGTAASPMTTIFVPVSTGPWITVPAGSTNIPVTDVTGFTVGQKIGIDMGGNYEVATVTAVGMASTQTNLAVAAKAGDTSIKVVDNANMSVGDTLTINTGARIEKVVVKRIVNVVSAPRVRGFDGPVNTGPGEVELMAPLQRDHMEAVDVSDRGTGITFTPATRFAHKSGEAVQALGSGIILEGKITGNYETGSALMSSTNTAGYQGARKPEQWFGLPLSATAGSIALFDASGNALVDGMVYGGLQGNSSANGTVASPEIATLEGNQHQGGCIVVLPSAGNRILPISNEANKSFGRFPDGADSDSNCEDFRSQNTTTLAAASQSGSTNIKVASTVNLVAGQQIIIGWDANSETAVIAEVGTSGATLLNAAAESGATTLAVGSAAGFSEGQTITIGTETAVIASVTVVRRRFGAPAGNASDTITLTGPLKNAYAANTQVAGTGITLTKPLAKAHDNGAQVAVSLPTPGEPNVY